MRSLRPALTAALLTAWPAAAPAQVAGDIPGDPAAGRDLAEVVCSACHRIPGMEPVLDAPGALPFQALADDPAVTEPALRAFLLGPHPTMPNIVLSPERLNDIIAYILRLRDG